MTRIFSGIQPTGRKHLGNYIGAITRYVEWQEKGEGIYCVVDLHATTVAYEPAALRSGLYDLTAILLAAGLDPARCILFRQSDVQEHAELQWLLMGVTGYGELQRMTQFKDKAGRQDLVSAGLFSYPVLMAADVLAYRADRHDVAGRFNGRFGEHLVIPEGVYPEVGARIMDLQEPTRKMSTTSPSPQGTVFVTDESSVVLKKFKSAVTDSGREIHYDREAKPGVSNLLEIYAAVRGTGIPEAERAFSDARGYGDLKTAVGEAVTAYLTPIRERYAELRADEEQLETILGEGAERARAIAVGVLADVREAMGVGPVREQGRK